MTMSDTIDADGLEDWLGEAPAPDKIEYLEQQNNRRIEIKKQFDAWFEEMEGHSFPTRRSSDLRTAEDPEAECISWFWGTLGEDEVYPKEFLEYLMQMSEDVRTGKVETIPMDEDFMNRLKDLIDDVELDNE